MTIIMLHRFNNWLNSINEQTSIKNYTLNDIWRGYDKINYNDIQHMSNSPIIQVQKKIIEKLEANPKTRGWAKKNGFKPDNNFGKLSTRALGLALTGIEFSNPESVSVGPNSLKKLGFNQPPTYSDSLKIVATTLSIEAGDGSSDSEIAAIANVILNRKYAINRYNKNVLNTEVQYGLTDIILDSSQFSLWNEYGNLPRDKKIAAVMKRRRPENNKNWKEAIRVAKLMLNNKKITDITKGATHYYNPKIVVPNWGKGKKWIEHQLGLVHTFGRDTATNWARKPVIRKA